tara:strand:+ start:600 stop:1181 length:582 start_codon:yes stop_codon:yes gene_type:complete
MKKHNTHGGGSKTNIHGLKFERDKDIYEMLKKTCPYLKFEDILQKKGTGIAKNILYQNKIIGNILEKHLFYNYFLEEKNIDYKKIISKKLLPDSVIINRLKKKVIIVEKKFQKVQGSVDEKLQTIDFKLKQYKKLCKSTNYSVDFIYLVNSFFLDKSYIDVKEYIKSVGGKIYVDYLPVKDFYLEEDSLKENK